MINKIFKYINILNIIINDKFGIEFLRIGGLFKGKSLFAIAYNDGYLIFDIFFLRILKFKIPKKYAGDIVRLIPLICFWSVYFFSKDEFYFEISKYYTTFFALMFFWTDVKKRTEEKEKVKELKSPKMEIIRGDKMKDKDE